MFDTEKLIMEVEQHVCLWNTSDKEYFHREAKSLAWEEVAEALYPNWESLAPDEREQKVADIQKKWKNVKDYYFKERKKASLNKHGKPTSKIKKYVYFDMLTFLDKTKEHKGTDVKCEEEDMSMEDLLLNQGCSDTQFNDSQHHNMQAVGEPNLGGKRTNMPTFHKLKLEKRGQQRTTTEDDIDEDKSFLLSLLPAVRQLSGVQKIDFKLEVLNTLKRIKYPDNS